MSDLVLAHISDLHIDGSAEALERTCRVVDALVAVADGIAAVLVSGDVSDRGEAADYCHARAEFDRVGVPVAWAVGNHDERTAFAAELLDRRGHDPSQPLNHVVPVGSARLVVLDSLIPGSAHGRLAPATLAWLARTLDERPVTPTVVALHHPPADLGLPLIDPIRLRAPERLEAVLVDRPQVVAVLCGHAHTPASASFAGRALRVAPGVRSTAVLPWEGRDAMMRADAPPAVSFHLIRREGVVTHTRMVPAPSHAPSVLPSSSDW